MKNAIKYLVLSISCVICFVVLVLMVALLLDIESLSYPATLILPIISYALFIGGFVMLTIWAFKFSNNKAHKTFLIISLSVFLASAVVFLSAKIVNPIISEEPETECFDFSHTEIVRHLEENSFMEFTPVTVTDLDENGERIATYTAKTLIYGEENVEEYVHYQFSYDDVTKKVRSIIILLKRDALLASSRYPWHICSIVEYINPNDENAKSGTLTTLIQEGFDKNDFAIYEGENFKLSASRMDEYFDAYFTPIKKGE